MNKEKALGAYVFVNKKYFETESKKKKKKYRCKFFKSYCSHNPFGNDD